MKKRMHDAYFTVEASFIIPLAFLLIILTLQYGFFCYEKSVSIQCCYLAALRASNEWELSGNDAENYATKEADKLLQERTLYPIKKEIHSKVTLLNVEVALDGNMEVMFAAARGDSVNRWETNAKKSVGRTVPSTYIRKLHIVKD